MHLTLSLSLASTRTYISYPYSYAFGKSTKTLLNDTLYRSLRKCAVNCGNQLAIVSLHENIERTFSQLVQDVDRFANALRINCDVRSGDVISVWTANAYFFVVVQYASAALGAILCPINAYYKAKEVQYCLEKVKPKVLIMPGKCIPFGCWRTPLWIDDCRTGTLIEATILRHLTAHFKFHLNSKQTLLEVH